MIVFNLVLNIVLLKYVVCKMKKKRFFNGGLEIFYFFFKFVYNFIIVLY